MNFWPFRKHHEDPQVTRRCDPETEARLADAQRRASEVRSRAERVATSLEKRRRENHFAEGLSAAWGGLNGRHR